MKHLTIDRQGLEKLSPIVKAKGKEVKAAVEELARAASHAAGQVRKTINKLPKTE